MIPEHLILSTTISKEIEGVSFDFIVKFTVFGEVLEVHNHFLELPDPAKKLIIGKHNFDFDTIVASHMKLFKFFMPLVALGYLKEKEWEESFQKIVSLRKNNPAFEEHFATGVSDNWIKEIYQLATEKSNSKLLKHFVNLANNDRRESKRKNGVYFLREKHPTIPSDFLNALFPTLMIEEEIQLGYEAYKAFPSLENYSFLKNRLTDTKYKKYWGNILVGLNGYTFSELEAFLFDFYRKNKNDKAIQAKTIECLAFFNSEQVLNLLEAMIASDHLDSSTAALKGLQKNGYSEIEIAKLINVRLLNPKSIEGVLVSLRLINFIKNKDLHVSVDDFINLLEWGNDNKVIVNNHFNIANELKYLLEDRATSKNYDRLINLLQTGNEQLQDAILIILSRIGLEEHMEVILSFLDKENASRTNKVLNVIKDLIYKYPTEQVIIRLIEMIQETDGQNRIKALEIMVSGLIENPLDLALPFVFKELKTENDSNRLLAVKALTSFRENEEVIKQLQELLEDPIKEIREQVNWVLKLMSDEETIELEQRQKLFEVFKDVMSWTDKEKDKVLSQKEQEQKEAELRITFEKLVKENPSLLDNLLKQKDFK